MVIGGAAAPIAGNAALDVTGGDLFVRQAVGSNNHVRIRGPSDSNMAIELRAEGLVNGNPGTPYIDFANDAASDYDVRIQMTGDDALMVTGANVTRLRYCAEDAVPSQLSLIKGRGTDAAPTFPLAGDGLGSIRFQGIRAGATFNDGATIASSAENNWALNLAPANLTFNTTPAINGIGPVERMRITAAGLVGIGTFAPVFNLDVVAPANQDGTIRVRGGSNVARLRLENAGLGGRNWAVSSLSNAFLPPGGFAISDETALIQRLVITNAGRIGIGTTAPDQMLSVVGGASPASMTGGGVWRAFSDRRMKKDISPYTDGLALIRAVNPVHYKYNGLGPYKDDGIDRIGVIAQDIQKIAPYMVDAYKTKLRSEDPAETDLLSFNGTPLIYALINAVKELETENHSIKERLEVQEKELQLLKRQEEGTGQHL